MQPYYFAASARGFTVKQELPDTILQAIEWAGESDNLTFYFHKQGFLVISSEQPCVTVMLNEKHPCGQILCKVKGGDDSIFWGLEVATGESLKARVAHLATIGETIRELIESKVMCSDWKEYRAGAQRIRQEEDLPVSAGYVDAHQINNIPMEAAGLRWERHMKTTHERFLSGGSIPAREFLALVCRNGLFDEMSDDMRSAINNRLWTIDRNGSYHCQPKDTCIAGLRDLAAKVAEAMENNPDHRSQHNG